jgi:hypothetical protein
MTTCEETTTVPDELITIEQADDRGLITVSEAAYLLDLSTRAVDWRIQHGQLPPAVYPPNRKRGKMVNWADIDPATRAEAQAVAARRLRERHHGAGSMGGDAAHAGGETTTT